MKLNKEKAVLGMSAASAMGIIVLVIQSWGFSRQIGRKEEQLETNRQAIVDLTKITTQLTKTTIELGKTVEFGAETTRDTRDELRSLEARVRQVEIKNGGSE